MQRFFQQGTIIISALVTLRSAFIFCTLALILGFVSQSYFVPVNKSLFSLAVWLAPKAPQSDNLVHIEIPSREMQRLLRDPSGALQLTPLLEKLASAYTKGILLIVPVLPYTDNYAADLLLQRIASQPKVKQQIKQADLWDEVSELEKRHSGFLSLLKNSEIILGVSAKQDPSASLSYLREFQRLSVQDSEQKNYFQWLPKGMRFSVPELGQFRYESGVPAYPIFSSEVSELAYPLLWRVNDDIFIDGVLEAYKKQQGLENVFWEKGQALHLSASKNKSVTDAAMIGAGLSMTADGTIFPAYSYASGLQAEIKTMALSEVVKQLHSANVGLQAFHEKTVVISVKGDASAENALLALQSLIDKQFYTTPSWAVWFEKITLLVLAIYLLALLPLLRMNLAILSTAFIASALLVFQMGLQITQGLWLPVGLVLSYLLLGHGLILLWLLQRKPIASLQKEADVYAFRLAKILHSQSKLDEALKILKRCRPAKQVLDLTYEVAASFERKRLYEKAAQAYLGLSKRKRGFRDAAKRAKQLKNRPVDDLAATSLEATAIQTSVLNKGANHKPILGRYEIDKELGKGAMGTVYLGHDPKISRQVAIKTLSYAQFPPSELGDLKARFFREAEAAGRLSHPSIVTVYDVGEEPDLAFIAMDYVSGQPLSAYIKKETLLDVEEVYWLMVQVADALGYAHEQKIVHRDIKPSNILYNRDGEEVKVADFGIARIVDNSSTKTGDIIGSPLYMSPEQLKGGKVDGQSDVFSLGVTFFQMLTGELPCQGDTLAALTYEIIHSKYPSVNDKRSGLPASAHRIINKALQKNPTKRYASAYDMSEAIHKSLEKDF